jgi:hypothetical protein
MRLLVIAVVLLCAPAAAQDYRGSIVRQLDGVQGPLASSGYRLDVGVHDPEVRIGAMAKGATVFLELTLAGGVEYLITAACDQDCSDLDSRIYPADDATSIAEDTALDAAPVLRFTAPRSTRYMLALTMVECTASVCYFGYRVLRR